MKREIKKSYKIVNSSLHFGVEIPIEFNEVLKSQLSYFIENVIKKDIDLFKINSVLNKLNIDYNLYSFKISGTIYNSVPLFLIITGRLENEIERIIEENTKQNKKSIEILEIYGFKEVK